MLRSAAGYHAFRRMHSSASTPARVAGFLLFNPAFPRSVHLCVREASRRLTEVKSRYSLRGGNDAAEDWIACALFSARSIEEILSEGLHEFLDVIQQQLIAVTATCSIAVFGHRPEAVQEQTAALRDKQVPCPSSESAMSRPTATAAGRSLASIA